MTTKKQVFIYPPVKEQATLDNVVSRLAWYLAPYIDQIGFIELNMANRAMASKVRLAPNLDPGIAPRLRDILPHLLYRSEAGLVRQITLADPKHDILLIIDETAEASAPAELAKKIAEFTRNGGRYRVDPLRTRQEGSFYLWAGLNKLSDAKALTAHYQGRFKALMEDVGQYQKAYVFGTGPGFSSFVDSHDFSDGLCIVANSIVKNKAALEKLKPRIICAADPIYHAGCSSYAAAFRSSLIEALDQTGAWFVCPLRDAGVYRAILPPHLQERMVCMPFDAKRGIPTDLGATFFINPFPNVLTLLLLPLASTFAPSIHIVGCDGRRLLDDSFFWSHDKKVQFSDQMAEIQAAHPGFFAIDYNDYYLDHCLDVEKVLALLEAHGKTVVNETASLIPALDSRSRRDDATPAPNIRTFVMLDPDANDDWGHFLAYDKRLATAARANGLNFALLCRQEMPAFYKPAAASSLHNVFTINSWTVGNKSPAERGHLLQFARELKQGLTEVEATYPDGDICVFFYVGSIEAAEVLEFLLTEHPRVHGVIDLFWSFSFDQADPAYQARWRAVAKRIDRHPRLHLMHATAQIAQEFVRDWDLSLPVLEHPSTTFADAEAKVLAETPIQPRAGDAGQPMRVLFPGGAREEKGFVLSIGACDLLRDVPELELSLRARLDKGSGAKLKRDFKAFDRTGIEIIDQDLSDDEFITMMREADIVVIPYHAEAFRRRTSGILVDAMLLGKPVIVLQDTWLADIVSVERTGVCVAPEARALAEGVLTVARDFDAFARHITAARKTYLHHNTWTALLRSVCALTGDQRFASVTGVPAGSDRDEDSIHLLVVTAARMLLGETLPGQSRTPALQAALDRFGTTHLACAHFLKVEQFAMDMVRRPVALSS